jgi:type II restriction enzyme
VRASYNRLRPLEKLQVEKRGWTLDALQVVQSLGKLEFTLADVYAQAGALAKLHPNNAHVRDKIRQQLQVLRDLGLLAFPRLRSPRRVEGLLPLALSAMLRR